MTERDIYEPRTEPARSIYRAIKVEAQDRVHYLQETWLYREADAAYTAATAYAIRQGGYITCMADVLLAEQSARGHTDYASKWARILANRILHKKPKPVEKSPTLNEVASAILRDALDAVEVHPCDEHNDDARAAALTDPNMRMLYKILKGEA